VRSTIAFLALFILAANDGCAFKGRDRATRNPKPAGESKLDVGPRAGAVTADAELASQGAILFREKQCAVCHDGERMAPNLSGVTFRRTNAWLEQQLLRPEAFVREDPIAWVLMNHYTAQMPNFGFTPKQVRALIEFLKSEDRTRSTAAIP
jgi:mono/diheme cytochrome c family protein